LNPVRYRGVTFFPMLGRFRVNTPSKTGVRRSKRRVAILWVAAFLVLGTAVLAPAAVFAQLSQADLGLQYGTALGLATTDIRTMIGNVIKGFIGLLGIVAVVLILYAGFLWMTAGGNEEKISKAKRIMINATIGLVIIMSSYAIVAWLFRAMEDAGLFGGGPGGTGSQFTALYRSGASSALGNGIIEYHYPEVGQAGVPRNTKISITFKKPLGLSSVVRNYKDNGSIYLADHEYCPDGLENPCQPVPQTWEEWNTFGFRLNTDNIKITMQDGLEDPSGGNLDDQFDQRHPDDATVVDPAPGVRVTALAAEYDPTEMQTLVITPYSASIPGSVPLGSASVEVNYRVALRGGDNGIKVFAPSGEDGSPEMDNAFLILNGADGSYFWPFATSTTLDTTPPKIKVLVPGPRANPASRLVDRNQLLQLYFDEAVDPTTASGVIGPGGGFTNIEIKARCLYGDGRCVFGCDTYRDLETGVWDTAGCQNDARCEWDGNRCYATDTASYLFIPGTLRLANRLKTAEFMPSAPCEGVKENSCGDQVYCLPKNVEIVVKVKAATVGDNPPEAIATDGVTDMVGNSFDGNKNGSAEGPTGGLTDYSMNNPPQDVSNITDNAYAEYHVGENIDLVPPAVTAIDPVSFDTGVDEVLYPGGPAAVPGDTDIAVTWDKIMSVTSLRTGIYDELAGQFPDIASTVAMRSRELEKNDPEEDCSQTLDCQYTQLDPPWFFLEATPEPPEDPEYSVLKVLHRPFFMANELGYTEIDLSVEEMLDRIPIYQPIVRSKIKDSKQNCFYPSRGMSGGYTCDATEENAACCNLGEYDQETGFICNFP